MSTGLDPQGTFDAIQSHALASGWFDRVNTHEPKNAPGLGLTVAIWGDRIQALARASGLDATAARVIFNIRVYSSMIQEPQDAIDPNILAAVSALFTAYVGDFELGGEARNIDILGAHGQALQAQAGYLNQDKRLFRVMTIFMPVIFNDVWEQSP